MIKWIFLKWKRVTSHARITTIRSICVYEIHEVCEYIHLSALVYTRLLKFTWSTSIKLSNRGWNVTVICFWLVIRIFYILNYELAIWEVVLNCMCPILKMTTKLQNMFKSSMCVYIWTYGRQPKTLTETQMTKRNDEWRFKNWSGWCILCINLGAILYFVLWKTP